jgi:putative Mg2+ transporter-C (MgtC) family protein
MTYAAYLNGQFSILQNIDFFLRLIVACLCGAVIGVERSKRLKEAGIRTHIIVCCGAALMMIVSKYAFLDLVSVDGSFLDGTKGADPARIAAQVVSGVSFLGAGVIFKNGNTIKGLTTAAGIWATAGIGLAIGSGMYILGIFSTLLIDGLQILMHKFKIGADSLLTYQVQFTIQENSHFQTVFNNYIKANKIQLVVSKVSRDDDGNANYELLLRSGRKIAFEELSTMMSEYPEVRSLNCIFVH